MPKRKPLPWQPSSGMDPERSQTIAKLVEKNPTIRDRHGRTALHLAAKKGYHEAIRVMVDKGHPFFVLTPCVRGRGCARVWVRFAVMCRCQKTPLDYAMEEGHQEVVRELVALGDGMPQLCAAVRWLDGAKVTLLAKLMELPPWRDGCFGRPDHELQRAVEDAGDLARAECTTVLRNAAGGG
eukprot:Sspe_Gene.35913::Locus_17387_Transcript_1_1_Confidence_1.000_Length_602::g.35913::m.35913